MLDCGKEDIYCQAHLVHFFSLSTVKTSFLMNWSGLGPLEISSTKKTKLSRNLEKAYH